MTTLELNSSLWLTATYRVIHSISIKNKDKTLTVKPFQKLKGP